MDHVEIKKTSCGICSCQCPLDVHVKDGKILSLEGGKNHPGQYGGICAKGAASKQYVYNKERVLYPMKRTGKKGEGIFERISWDEAYDLMAGQLLRLKETYGPESVVFYAGYPKWFRPALLRFANAYGSPNFCTESSTCFQAVDLAWGLTFGGHVCFPDLKHAKTVLMWSRNPYHSALDGSEMYHCMKERGVHFIAVDARHSETAHDAGLRLQPLPGTDGALALSMGYVIVSENLYDREFVETYVEGFAEYKAYVENYTPERAEAITGVPAEKIRQAARMYACEKPSAIVFSPSAIVHHVNGVQNQRAIFALCAITGNYDVDGGNVRMPGPAAKVSEFHGVKRLKEPEALGEREYPAWFDLSCEQANGAQLADYILKEQPYPIRGMFALGFNHRMWPLPDRLLEATGKLDFFVNTELFLSESCANADLVLPAASAFEREIIPSVKGNWVELTQKVIEPLGEAKNDIEIIMELMKRMGLSDEALSGTYEDYLNYILKDSGLTAEELRMHPGGMAAPNVQMPRQRSYEREPFLTPSGKIELKSAVLEAYRDSHGYEGLPVYEDFREKNEAWNEEYPLILNTGSRRPQLFHARLYRIPWLKDLEETPLIQIHPETGEKLKIRDGAWVSVSTPAGSIKGHLVYHLSVLPGVVCVYHGDPLADANNLIPTEYKDPISGYPGYKSYLCKIREVEA